MSQRSERIGPETASTGPPTSSARTGGRSAPDFIIELRAQDDGFVAAPPSSISASLGYDMNRYKDLCEVLNNDILQQVDLKRDNLFTRKATFASSKKTFSIKLTKAVRKKPTFTANTFRWEHLYALEGDAGKSNDKVTQTPAGSTGGRSSKRSGQSGDSGGSSKRTKATPSGTTKPEDDDQNPDTGLA